MGFCKKIYSASRHSYFFFVPSFYVLIYDSPSLLVSHKSKTAQYLSARDQGQMAETCCAEENEINYQIDCLGGFV